MGAVRPGFSYARRIRRGFGDITQAAGCPSAEQLAGIPDSSDPCQAAAIYSGQTPCVNSSTGDTVPCPIAGTLQVGSPASSGPFGPLTAPGGLLSSNTLLWIALAAVGAVVLVNISD